MEVKPAQGHTALVGCNGANDVPGWTKYCQLGSSLVAAGHCSIPLLPALGSNALSFHASMECTQSIHTSRSE